MAKIRTSALIDSFSGSMGGTTFKRNKGGLFMMNKMRPRNPRSELQQRTRLFASYFSGKWNSLPDTSKQMWNQFASLSSKKWSGVNAYVALNMNLVSCNCDSLTPISIPPLTPSTPRFPFDFEVRTIGPTLNTIYWTQPSDPDTFVCVYFSAQSCYSQKGKESWKLVGTVPASDFHIDHVHDYPSGTVLCYRIHSIDLFGRLSPKSHISTGPFEALSLDAGRYGLTSYGFSYYCGTPRILISDTSIGAHSTNVMNAFIFGFGSGIDSGNFTIISTSFESDIAYAIANDFDIFVRSTTNMESKIPTAESSYPSVQFFMPSGSNSHIEIYDSGGTLPVIVTAGGGDTENETGWDIEFFDVDPFTPEPNDWSSYANGVIAGKIFKIKHTLDCSWWEARYRARMTASRDGVWNEVDGYGLIDVDAALSFRGEIPPDPYI